MLEERLGIRTDLIEHQLSHSVRDPTGRAYKRTQFLDQRAEMMQTWADYLFQLKDGYAEVDEKAVFFGRKAEQDSQCYYISNLEGYVVFVLVKDFE